MCIRVAAGWWDYLALPSTGLHMGCDLCKAAFYFWIRADGSIAGLVRVREGRGWELRGTEQSGGQDG